MRGKELPKAGHIHLRWHTRNIPCWLAGNRLHLHLHRYRLGGEDRGVRAHDEPHPVAPRARPLLGWWAVSPPANREGMTTPNERSRAKGRTHLINACSRFQKHEQGGRRRAASWEAGRNEGSLPYLARIVQPKQEARGQHQEGNHSALCDHVFATPKERFM